MSAKLILLLCVFVCIQNLATSKPTQKEIGCQYKNITYKPNTKFKAETCVSGCCNKDGVLELTPTCCDYENKTYKLNTSVNISPCTFGFCGNDGQVAIAVIDCPLIRCPVPIHVDGQCCSRCPDEWAHSCEYNGTFYKVNSTFQAGTCLSGYCNESGEVTFTPTCCDYKNNTYKLNTNVNISLCNVGYCGDDGKVVPVPMHCPLIACPEPVHVDGECCPRCPKCWAPSCEYNGTLYQVNSTFQAGTCLSGYCNESCEVTFTTTCCEYENNTYEIYSSWNISPCMFAFCFDDGEIAFAYGDCGLLPCPEPIHVEGECCSRCPAGWVPSCEYRGVVYEANTTFQIDTCLTGFCNKNGRLGRGRPSCCEYENKTYPIGSNVNISPCQFGFCGDDGEVVFAAVDCFPLQCPRPIQIRKEDECCSRCPDGWVPSCEYGGVVYEPNTTFQMDTCLTGFCNKDGRVGRGRPSCCEYENITYPLNTTFQAETCVTGYCNENGDVELTPSCCEYDNITYTLNQDYKIAPCIWGFCDSDGQFSTAYQDCARPPCENVIFDEGECCGHCPDGWQPTCVYGNETFEIYSYFIISDCETGYCRPDGQVEGQVMYCTPPPCPDYIYDEGVCCPRCPEGQYCFYNGRYYPVGDIPTESPCEDCSCPPEGGEPKCYWSACLPLNCTEGEEPFIKPGECCAQECA